MNFFAFTFIEGLCLGLACVSFCFAIVTHFEQYPFKEIMGWAFGAFFAVVWFVLLLVVSLWEKAYLYA